MRGLFVSNIHPILVPSAPSLEGIKLIMKITAEFVYPWAHARFYLFVRNFAYSCEPKYSSTVSYF